MSTNPSNLFPIDTTPPTVIWNEGVLGIGHTVMFTLGLSEAVTVSGTPALTLNDGGTATFVTQSSANTLVFVYTVPSGENASSLALTGVGLPNGATVQDLAGNAANFSGVSIAPNLPNTATLTFDDEFNSLSLWNGARGTWDTSSWYAAPNGMNHGNELEWYPNVNYAPTSSVRPWSVNNGELVLTAAPADPSIQPYINNYQYTSGWLDTDHTFAQTYGFFEMRAQLPAGQGLWPAFWLVPTNGSWPPELDIMEMLGNNPNILHTTVWSNSTGQATSVSAGVNVADMSIGYHTYAVDWEPTTITWFFDGQPVFQTATPSDLNTPMYMILNLAVGGDWPGNPNASTTFPAQMGVDYVRVYTSAPLTAISVTASPSGGSEGLGTTVVITLAMSEAVTVSGIPTLSLNNGGTATYDPVHSTSTTLVFNYTVNVGDQNTTALTVTQINLPNGAAVQDTAGNYADFANIQTTLAGLQINTAVVSAPTIASFSPDSGTVGDGITNDNTLTLSGTAEANSTVKVYDGATLLGSATANASGAWSYITAALSDGAHSLTAAARDAAGNTGVASAALVVTVDTVAPNAPVIVSDTTINTNEVALSGTAEANSTVNVFEGTTQLGTATVDASGAWSFTTGPLSSGTHTFTATATDAAGNTSAASQPIDPAIDQAAPPSIVAFSPDSGTVGDGITNANTLTLTGAAVASSTVNIYDGTTLLGTAASNGRGAWSFTTATLVNGSHSFTATDTVSGATSAASAALAVIVDTVAPAVTDHLASDTGSSSTDKITSIDTLTGSGDPNAVVHFTVDGTPIAGTATANSSGVWTFAPTGLADGHHTIVASETDAAGNTGTASLTFTLDTKAPVVTESLAKDTGSSSTDKITSIDTLTGSGDPNAVVHFTVDGNLIEEHTATANSSGIWTFTPNGLANGTHTIVTSETDAAGNTGTASLTFTFDTTAPTTTIADIVQKTANNVSTTTISGTSEAGSLVTLYEGNHVLGKATVANTGQWSISLNSLSNTVHNFTAAATDLAGNNGTHSHVAIFGSTGSDNIVGVAAGDIIFSSGGADKLTAGSGNDTFIFNPGFGKDTVSKFDLNHDVLAFDHTLFASVANVLSHAENIHGNAVITFDSGDTVTLVGIKTAQLLAHQNDIHII